MKGGGHLFKNGEHETEGRAFLSAGPCPALRVARSPRSHPWPVRRRIPDILSGRAVAQAVEMSGSAYPQIHVPKRQTVWPLGLAPLPVGTRRLIRICTEKQEKGQTLTGLQSSVSAAQKTQTHPSTLQGGSHVSRASLGTGMIFLARGIDLKGNATLFELVSQGQGHRVGPAGTSTRNTVGDVRILSGESEMRRYLCSMTLARSPLGAGTPRTGQSVCLRGASVA